MRVLFTTCYDADHIGIRLLAAYMQQQGHEVHFLQMKVFPITDYRQILDNPKSSSSQERKEQQKTQEIDEYITHASEGLQPPSDEEISLFYRAITDWNPDVAAVSYRTVILGIVERLLPVMRKAAPQAFLVGGGFGPTFDPETALTRLGFDAVVRGEGEEPLRELLESIAAKRSWENIDNLAYLKDGKVQCNPLRPLLLDLDSYPFPLARQCTSCIENNEYRQGDSRKPGDWPLRGKAYSLMATRGCPLKCSYCYSVTGMKELYHGEGLRLPAYRRRSLDNVLEELRSAKQQGERSFHFVDEFVIYPPKQLLYFFKEYKRDINLFFFAYLQAEQLLHAPGLMDAAIDAGWAAAFFGVQSGDEQFAREVYNRHNNNQNFIDCIRQLFARGIMSSWAYIGNNLLETDDVFQRTLAFAKALPFDPGLTVTVEPAISRLCIYPKTPLSRIYPKGTYDRKKFYYQSQLLRLRNMVNDEQFEEFSSHNYKDTPQLLGEKLTTVRQNLHHAYLMDEIERLAGKKVYFWGLGESYHKNKHLFRALRPVCMLHDLDDNAVEEIDGLKVRQAKDVLPFGEPLPIVIFSYGSYIIHRKIMRDYPVYTDKVFVQLR